MKIPHCRTEFHGAFVDGRPIAVEWKRQDALILTPGSRIAIHELK
jgi:hypothetical protein